MKEALLVTLADANYVEQAKQLFSSAYWNAGWKGDYMLLAHEVPREKLKWFKDKGIIVYECSPLGRESVGRQGHPPAVLDKLYLFKAYFKKWRNVVFLDADIIIRASLDDLANVHGFAAPHAVTITIHDEYYAADPVLWDEFKKLYFLRGHAFNTGVFAFSTDIINPDSFDVIVALYRRFGRLNICGEEGTLNLFFRGRWRMLPMVYNMFPDYTRYGYFIPYKEMKTIILHFVVSAKPWNVESHFYEEWLENYRKAEAIDLSRPQPPCKIWTEREIRSYLRYLAAKKWLYTAIDRYLGKAGIIIRRIFPRLYRIIKSWMPDISRPRGAL